MNFRLALALSFLLTVASVPAIAQIKAIQIRPATPARLVQPAQVPGAVLPGAPTVAPAPTVDASAAARESKKTSLLQQLNQLKLSRLPSEILDTWAKPLNLADSTNDDESEDETDNEPLPPAPPSAFLYNEKRFERVRTKFQRDFVLGNWKELGTFLDLLPEQNATQVYDSILVSLGQSAPLDELTKLRMQQSRRNVDPRTLEKQYLSYSDLISIAKIAPEIKDKQLQLISQLAFGIIQRGTAVEDLVAVLKTESDGDDPTFTKRQSAKILIIAKQPIESGQFLPSREEAIENSDFEALNLLSVHLLSIHARDKQVADLEEAWKVTQAILNASEVESKERQEAITRAVSLASQVREDLGQKWLDESFTGEPERGIEIIAAIGSDTAKSMRSMPTDATTRLKKLKIQNDAVNAMLENVGAEVTEWKDTLNLLSLSWLREAVVAYEDDDSTGLNPGMQRDMYGNIFYMNNRFGRPAPSRGVSPITTGELLEVQPSANWLSLIDESLKPKFDSVLAQLYLKVGEENLAFPFIESLGQSHPELAQELVNEFLKVWTKNHDPNSSRSRTNNYMFMFGFEQRAESIPLTRSKQERNLEELTELIPRLKALELGDVDQDLIADAFTKCHSSAEVYQPEDIAAVFGSLDAVEPKVIAKLANRMRTNLATMWRDASVQKDQKTKRRKKEMEAEVVRGYAVAKALVASALVNNEDSWALLSARASLMHDENNYKSDLANHNGFANDRKAAMAEFKKAADIYISQVSEMEESDYETTVFENWFYATLGACDLNLIEDTHSTAANQADIIRQTLQSIPNKAVEWHQARFANLLFNRMSSAKSTLKFRYLKTGFEIIGDHKQARKAKEVFEYYNDLVTEIQLVARIDGSDKVGHENAFGLYVDILHTAEIERESGGFGRYLQNQNASGAFSYNYGRPTEDYRDKFEEYARDILGEQFDIKAVTFETPEVSSKATDRAGWRRTPYAYLLLKPRGPEVDEIPSVKLDLDFLDTSGYAVIPIETKAIPIDALTDSPDARPATVTEITQILDERQAAEGNLIVEVKATSQGLTPSLDSLFEEVAFENFDVVDTEDQGVSVTKFDGDSPDATVLSDRSWLVKLKAKGSKRVKNFDFPTVSSEWENAETVYQRYVDADLRTVEQNVDLEEKYGKLAWWQIALFVAAGFGILMLLIVCVLLINRSVSSETTHSELPEDLTPFAVLTRLKNVQQNNGLSESGKLELGQSINRLEAHYFGSERGTDSPDLNEIAQKWLRTSR
jgi:hypothetical protein